MIKKLTAYSLILIANIVLFTHAVIPHHHHESVFCIEQMHCQGDALPHNQNIPEHNHQHDGNKNSTSCILEQSVVVPTTQDKNLKTFNNCSDNHNHDYYTLSDFWYSDLQPVSNVVTYSHVHSSYLQSFVTSILRLRAPPTV
jgi:hypothetical protein